MAPNNCLNEKTRENSTDLGERIDENLTGKMSGQQNYHTAGRMLSIFSGKGTNEGMTGKQMFTKRTNGR